MKFLSEMQFRDVYATDYVAAAAVAVAAVSSNNNNNNNIRTRPLTQGSEQLTSRHGNEFSDHSEILASTLGKYFYLTAYDMIIFDVHLSLFITKDF